MERAEGINASDVEEVFFGNVLSAGYVPEVGPSNVPDDLTL